MADNKDLASLTANLYAQELMKFVVRHHGIEWNSVVTPDLWEDVTQVFHDDVGKIVVAYAKSTEKDALVRTGHSVRRIISHDQYEVYCKNFGIDFFKYFDHSPKTILMFFTIVIEHSILLYKLGLEDAPTTAVDVIATSLLRINGGKFVMTGGLNQLNESATCHLARDPALGESYKTGTFAW